MWIFLLPLTLREKKKTSPGVLAKNTTKAAMKTAGVLVIIAAGSEPLLLKNLERLREANVPRAGKETRVGPDEGRVHWGL